LYNSDSFDILNSWPMEKLPSEQICQPVVEEKPIEIEEVQNDEEPEDLPVQNIIEGKIDLGNGLILYGKIVDGLLDGQCKFEQDGVITSEIFFQNGQKNGECKFYNEGKLLTSFTCQNDKREGITNYYNPDGTLSKMETYQNDKKNGPSVTYYPTSEVMEECTYADDKLIGDLYRYNKKGKIIEHVIND